jgi:hypothetical protein
MDVHAEILDENGKPPRQSHLKWQQRRFFHALAHPADALAQKFDDADRHPRVLFEKAQKIAAAQNEKLAGFGGDRIGGARLAVEKRDLAEQIAGPEHVQGQRIARSRAGFDADLAAPDPVKRIAFVAFDEKRFAFGQGTFLAETGELLDCRGIEPGKERVDPQQSCEVAWLVQLRAPIISKASTARRKPFKFIVPMDLASNVSSITLKTR